MGDLVRPALTLDPVAAAVSAARRYVAEALEACGRPDLEASATLGVSELVTNAVLHGRTPITVTVVAVPGGVRIEVTDRSPLPPQRRRLSALATTGRGLRLVGSISSSWGVDHQPSDGLPGKTVWFEPVEEPTETGFLDADWAAEIAALTP
jgi:anti-sigma regulatory factor (Ser/Thr protein kinase)